MLYIRQTLFYMRFMELNLIAEISRLVGSNAGSSLLNAHTGNALNNIMPNMLPWD